MKWNIVADSSCDLQDLPGIAFAGGLYAYTLTGLTSKSRESYANAGIIAEQVSIFGL